MQETTHTFAEQGPFCTAMAKSPVLQYFPVRGRAEPLRLVLAYKGVKWFEPPADPIVDVMREDLDNYPFRQLPKYIEDGEIDIVQSNAILRHLARRFDLYGSNIKDHAYVDMLIDGVEDLRDKLKAWRKKGFDTDATETYCKEVLASEEDLKASNMMGVGMACFEHILESRSKEGKGPWIMGELLTVADFTVFNMVDVHLGYFKDAMRKFPLLLTHHAALAQLPGVKDFLVSDERHKHVWMFDWLDEIKLAEESELPAC